MDCFFTTTVGESTFVVCGKLRCEYGQHHHGSLEYAVLHCAVGTTMMRRMLMLGVRRATDSSISYSYSYSSGKLCIYISCCPLLLLHTTSPQNSVSQSQEPTITQCAAPRYLTLSRKHLKHSSTNANAWCWCWREHEGMAYANARL